MMFAGMSGGDFLPKVTVSGKPGSGTSTLVDLLAKDMGWDSVNGGDIFRQEAKRLNLSVEEFSRLCKENFEVDRSLDDMLKNLISSENGPFIVESRLSGWWAYLEGIDCLDEIYILKILNQKSAKKITTQLYKVGPMICF